MGTPCTPSSKKAVGYGTIDASRELVIGIAVEPHMRWRRYAKLVGEFVQRIGVSQVVMLGAYLVDLDGQVLVDGSHRQ